MRDAAQRLAARGFRLLPVAGKIAMLEKWPERASIEAEFLDKWWAVKKPPNIGIATGKGSGVFVLDVDPKKGGERALAELEAKHGKLPKTVTAITGSAGFHCYFRHVEGLRNSANQVGNGIDIRADGGYVVAPPSTHPDGGKYAWAPERSPEETPIVDAPEWLVHLAMHGQVVARVTDVSKLGAPVPQGERHRMMVSLAGHLLNYGFDGEMALETLSLFWAKRCEGEPHRGEIERTVKSALQTFERNPPRLGMSAKDCIDISSSEDIGGEIDAIFSKYRHQVVGHPNSTELHRHNSRPEIVLSGALGRNVEALDAVLSQDGKVFHAATGLMELVTDVDGSTKLKQFEALQSRASSLARWYVMKKGDRVEVNPPPDAAHELANVNATGHIKRISGVSNFPALLPGGRYRAQTGLDEETGVFFALDKSLEGLQLPERPALAEACAAVDTLMDPLCDFPFTSERDRAAWLAALLTPLARRAIDGPVPMALFSANLRGSGKSKLCDVISLVVSGSLMPRGAYADDDAEMRKTILAMAIESRAMCLFDNVDRVIGCSSLDAALTGDSVDGRVLGKNVTATVPWKCSLFATGNNLSVRGDTVRRVIRCEISSKDDRPEYRTGFKYPDLFRTVRARRIELLKAALIILKHHFDQGAEMPGHRPAFGSYESWSAVVRGAVLRSMGVDPYEPPAIEEDDEAQAYRHFLVCLKRAGTPLTTKSILEAVEASGSEESVWYGSEEALRQMAQLAPRETLDSVLLGHVLKRFLGRPCSGVGMLQRRTVAARARVFFVGDIG